MTRALPLLLLLSACAAPGPVTRLGCTGEVRLANASGQVIEQAFVGAPGAWGADLLAPGTLAPGASSVFRLAPAPGRRLAVRVVFDTGRAAELPNLDLCETPDVTVERGAVRAAPRGRS
jgi:hypothetical protein